MQKNVSATYSAPGCNISAVHWPTNPPIYIFVGKQMEGHWAVIVSSSNTPEPNLGMRCMLGFHAPFYQQELTRRAMVCPCRANIPLIPLERNATEVTDISSDVSNFN